MKTNTMLKILFVVLLALTLVSTGLTIVNAANATTIPIDTITGTTDKETNPLAGGVSTVAGYILGVVQVVAAAVAVIMLVVLAVKYILASPNDKADIKSSITRYVIGAVILFGASGILGWIQSVVLNATKTNIAG